jgi:hypothetical protein
MLPLISHLVDEKVKVGEDFLFALTLPDHIYGMGVLFVRAPSMRTRVPLGMRACSFVSVHVQVSLGC